MSIVLENVIIKSIEKINKDYAVMYIDNNSILRLKEILFKKFNEDIDVDKIYVDNIKGIITELLYSHFDNEDKHYTFKFFVKNNNEVFLYLDCDYDD